MGAYTPDEMLVVLGFTVEIDNAGAGSDPDSAWESACGGELNVEIADASVGSDQTHQTTPGHKYVGEITLRGPLTSGRKALTDWINDAARGRNPRRTVTITAVPLENPDEPVTRVFEDAVITGYRFPRIDLADPCLELFEELRFAFGRVVTVPPRRRPSSRG